MAQDDDALRLSSPRWYVSQVSGRYWREWEGDVAVYQEATASTHLLEADLASVFLALCAAGTPGLDEAGLWREVDEAEPSEAQRKRMRDILDSLQTSGLAECRAP